MDEESPIVCADFCAELDARTCRHCNECNEPLCDSCFSLGFGVCYLCKDEREAGLRKDEMSRMWPLYGPDGL